MAHNTSSVLNKQRNEVPPMRSPYVHSGQVGKDTHVATNFGRLCHVGF